MKSANMFVKIRQGFTIMETLLAIGIISMLLGIFMTLFLPAKNMVRASIAKGESERITSVLHSEMMTLRDNEMASDSATESYGDQYISGFDKAFDWLTKSTVPRTSIVIFSYRADVSKDIRDDGTYPAVKLNANVPQQQHKLVTMACPLDSILHREDIKHAVGPVFLVRMNHLEEKPNGTFELVDRPGYVRGGNSPLDYVSSPNDTESWGGYLLFRADFFMLSPPDPARYSRRTWEQMGQPIFSTTLSIRR